VDVDVDDGDEDERRMRRKGRRRGGREMRRLLSACVCACWWVREFRELLRDKGMVKLYILPFHGLRQAHSALQRLWQAW